MILVVGSVSPVVKRKPVPNPETLLAATRTLEQARRAWEVAIIDAVTAGASYREVADAAGVSHGTIASIVAHHGKRS